MSDVFAAEHRKRTYIPEMARKEIEERARRIKPVVRMRYAGRSVEENGDGSVTVQRAGWERSKTGELCYIKPVDIYAKAYTWDPKRARKAPALKKLCDITTYHGFGYHGFFKPSISEVLRQIPPEHLKKVVAFEIIRWPEDVDDLNREREALNAGYHVATTRLYARK